MFIIVLLAALILLFWFWPMLATIGLLMLPWAGFIAGVLMVTVLFYAVVVLPAAEKHGIKPSWEKDDK